MKGDPSRLIRAHYATFVNDRTGRQRPLDYVPFVIIPAGVGVYCALQSVKLPPTASGVLAGVCGVFSGLLFQAMLIVAQRAADWVDQEPKPGVDVSRQAGYLRQMAANSGYGSLVSLVAAGVFVVAAVTYKGVLIGASAIALAAMTHLALTMLLVLQRVFAWTEGRLTAARTGAEVRRLPQKKKAS
jgi:hypothetical protein